MNDHHLKEILRQALPPARDNGPARDLWPEVSRRIAGPDTIRGPAVPWLDWALLGGLVGFAALVPASIPVFLYYL